jgi:hypothetical protein
MEDKSEVELPLMSSLIPGELRRCSDLLENSLIESRGLVPLQSLDVSCDYGHGGIRGEAWL